MWTSAAACRRRVTADAARTRQAVSYVCVPPGTRQHRTEPAARVRDLEGTERERGCKAKGCWVAMRLEKLRTKDSLLMGDMDQEPRATCGDPDRMERPRVAKRKGAGS